MTTDIASAIIVDIILLGTFLAVLVKSAIFVVDAIVKFSRMVGISELAAGFIIVAIATSTPEISVALVSVSTDNIGITLGDIFGSNVTNIALILGIVLVAAQVSVNFSVLTVLISFMVLVHLVFFAFLLMGRIRVWQSLTLFSIYAVFLISIYEIQIVIGGFSL